MLHGGPRKQNRQGRMEIRFKVFFCCCFVNIKYLFMCNTIRRCQNGIPFLKLKLLKFFKTFGRENENFPKSKRF